MLAFFADRVKVHLRERACATIWSAPSFGVGEDDLVRLLARVDALEAFLEKEDGANLLTAYRRAANILRIEEKKDGNVTTAEPDPDLFSTRTEGGALYKLHKTHHPRS